MKKYNVIIGENKTRELAGILKSHRPRHIFLVTGKESFVNCGAKVILDEILNSYNYTRYFDFQENPKIEDVIKGITLFKKKRCDFVIAIGGGSVIDMAKLINSCQVHDVTPEEIVLSNKIENSGKTLVAIPTTAGTGSEATAFAVVYINSVKYSLSHNKLLPKIAILDPQFSYNLPKYLTAVSGMDAFAQAIESFWNVNSNTESLMYAREAINLIWHELPIVLKHNTKSARLKLLKGAHMAGKAINITKTTAPHALSYPFTAHFGLPHGHAVALTLPNFVEYNYNVNDQDCNDPRGVDYVKECIEQLAIIMNFKTVKDLRSGLDQFIKRIGINISRNRFHFDKKSNLDLILKNINLQRFKNNPRNLNSELLIKILMDNL